MRTRDGFRPQRAAIAASNIRGSEKAIYLGLARKKFENLFQVAVFAEKGYNMLSKKRLKR